MKLAHLVISAALVSAVTPRAFAVTARGGNTTNDIGVYRIHTFTNSATASSFAVTTVSAGDTVEVLVVAGGGGGGQLIGGGGGAGGFISDASYAVEAGNTYAVTVGGGGTPGSGWGSGGGGKGGNSVFGALIADGGGGGGNYDDQANGATAGGSGGGIGASCAASAMAGTDGQGNAGGITSQNGSYGAGGGGASTVGTNGVNGASGAGGAGLSSDISGTLIWYAGGGGGGIRSTGHGDGGTGGLGGGGAGSASNAVDGAATTGGGGGGSGFQNNHHAWRPGAGGSGIVMVRYSRAKPHTSNGDATNITSTSAWLNGTLTSTGLSDTAVFAFWGLTDGGTNASAWAYTNVWAAAQTPGAFTIQATDLTVDSSYCYRFAASNAAGWAWATETAGFLTGEVWIENATDDASERGLNPGTFTVRRAATATTTALVVNYTVGGTATSGVDYIELSGTVTILAGEDSAVIEVAPIFDYLQEGPETVVVTLASGLYTIGAASHATVTIADYGTRADENLFLWQKRMPLTFSGYTPPGGETLVNFPVLVILSNTAAGDGFAYSDFQSPPYADLRFTAGDKKTHLDFEVESWDTNGLSYVWVRVPELTADTTIYALWGQSGIGAPPPNDTVWDATFKAVWHLANAMDSSSNAYHGTVSGGTSSTSTPAVVGDGWNFDGSDDTIQFSGLTWTPTRFSVSYWIKPNTRLNYNQNIGNDWNKLTIHTEAGGGLYAGTDSGSRFTPTHTGGNVYEAGKWADITFAFDSGTAALYKNGQLLCSKTGMTLPTVWTGGFYLRNTLDGIVDEVRVSNVSRSSNWVWACYQNTASNDLFTGYGVPEFQDFPEIEKGGWATNVTPTSAWLNGTLSSTGFSATAVSVYWGPTDGGAGVSAWANTNTWAAPQTLGAFTIEATGLSPNSTYYYRFAASNAAGWVWASETSIFITGDVWIDKLSDASETDLIPGTFTVHRASAVTNEALIVTYTVDGTATPGIDYVALSGTVTIPKGEQTATIEVLPIFDHLIEGTETVELTVTSGPYVIGSLSTARVDIADHGLVTRTWDGGGATFFASNPTNWVDDILPIAGDAVVLDSRTAKNMTWDLNSPVQSWTQDGYLGTVAVATAYPGQGAFTNFTVIGDCVISNGVWTHLSNPGTVTNVNNEMYRLQATIGGNLIVGTNATINVTGMGYAKGKGPGTAGDGQQVAGSSHGGRGVVLGSKTPGLCYGSIVAPTNLGSGGGYSAGGGAILVKASGAIRNDGLICADGVQIDHYQGSGGSVFLVAGALTGSGTIQANGGNMTGTASPAGGGRVALVLTNSGAAFSAFTGAVKAYGTQKTGLANANAGTIYLETSAHAPGKGELIVDNFGGSRPYGPLTTDLNGVDAVSYEFSRITLTNNAQLNVGPDDTLIVTNTMLIGADRLANGIWLSGGSLQTPADFAYSNMFIGISAAGSTFSPGASLTIGANVVLYVDQPHAMQGDLIVKAGGLLSHTPNPAAQTESYKIDLALNGSLMVEAGGLVDVTGRGFPASYGPGTFPFSASGASHGGLGLGGLSCYGSLVAPTNLGSGGLSGGAGGGTLRLAVSGVVSNGGGILANATTVTANTGAGGSICITAGALAGAGPIQANAAPNVTGVNPGGGGRIALTVTNAGETVFAYTGAIAAYGGRKPADTSGGAGTVYLRNPGQGLYDGTLIVDNDNLNGLGTEISSNVTDTTVANVLIQRQGYLRLATNQALTVTGVWSNSANFAGLTDSAIIFSGDVGSTSTIYGATSFKGLVCTNAGHTLAFAAASTNAVAAYGRLILRGDATTKLLLRPTVSETAWYLNVDALAEQDIEFVDVAYSDGAAGVEIVAKNSTGEDQGNVNWKFMNVTPGETITWTGNANTRWGVPGNWNPTRAPIETDLVVIPGSRPNYPVFDSARTVNRLQIQAGGYVSLSGYDLTVPSNLTVAGTLIASSTETVTLLKDADFTGGLFESALSSLVLAGDVAQSANLGGLTFYKVLVDNSAATVTLSGGFTATELRCEAPSGARSLAFEAGKTVTLRDLVLRGASPGATNILLRSTADGQTWKLAVSGYRSVSGVNVKDSDASVGLSIPTLASKDGGENTNWTFGVAPARWLGASANFHTAANWSPAVVPGAATRVLVESAKPMTMTGTVSILDLTVGGGIAAASVTVNGNMTVGESVVVLDKGTLTWNKPGVVSNELIIASGGRLTHSANSATEANKIDVTVGRDVGVDAGGVVDVTGMGYTMNKGPGTSGSNGGCSYGGRGAIYSSWQPGLCYGSFVAPTNLGSGGKSSAGGGAILVKASGAIRNDGLFCADGAASVHYEGSGGTVFLTAGTLTGTGTIRANGGDMLPGSYAAAAGGGRIALIVTRTGADFSAYTGLIQARSSVLVPAGVNAYSAGAGTVYRQTAANRPGRGTVTVDNANLTSSGFTDVPPYTYFVPGEVDRAVFRMANAAQLRLTNDFTVGDIWLDTANAWLDLGGHMLTVNTREHPLGLVENISNPGEIIWTGLRPGVLIIVK